MFFYTVLLSCSNSVSGVHDDTDARYDAAAACPDQRLLCPQEPYGVRKCYYTVQFPLDLRTGMMLVVKQICTKSSLDSQSDLDLIFIFFTFDPAQCLYVVSGRSLKYSVFFYKKSP